MKSINFKPIFVVLCIIFLATSYIYSQDVEIFNQVRISTKSIETKNINFLDAIKDDEGNYYVLFRSSADVYIDDYYIQRPDPINSLNINDIFIIISKFDSEFNYLSSSSIYGVIPFTYRLRIDNGKVYFGSNTRDIIVNDEVIEGQENERYSILEFDADLSFIKKVPLNDISRINLLDYDVKDGLLMNQLLMGGQDTMLVVKKDTINNYSIELSNGASAFSFIAPVLASYDLVADTIIHAWRMGGWGETGLAESTFISSDKNMTLGCTSSNMDFTFDDIEHFGFVKSCFYVIYDQYGKVIAYDFLKDFAPMRLVQVFPDNDEYYFKASHDEININILGTDIPNIDAEGNHGFRAEFIVKMNKELEWEWAYGFQSNMFSSNIEHINVDGEHVVIAARSSKNAELVIQGNTYTKEPPIHFFVVLDKETGEEISHLVMDIRHDTISNYYKRSFEYVDLLPDGNLNMIISTNTFFDPFFGIVFGMGYHQELLCFNLSLNLLTSLSEATNSDFDLFKILSNPVRPGDFVSLNLKETKYDSQYKLVNIQGQLVKEGNIRGGDGYLEISTSDLIPGSYVLHVNDGTTYKNEMIIIQ